jgi:hypothetical protein
LPGLKYNHHRRLPGPHYLLENAFLSQKDGDDDAPLPPGANPAVALAAAGLHYSTHRMSEQGEWDTEFCAPEMPTMLQHARGLVGDSLGPMNVGVYYGMANDSLSPTVPQTEQDNSSSNNNLSPPQGYDFPTDFANHGRRLPLIPKMPAALSVHSYPLPLPSEHYPPLHSQGNSQASMPGPILPDFGGHSYSAGSGYGSTNHMSKGYHQSQ